MAENETFGEYIDRVLGEISKKIADKRSPGDAKGYGRDAFIDIAREYNAYNYNERGSIRSRYSNNELAVNIERVLIGMSEGMLTAREGLTILSDMQENTPKAPRFPHISLLTQSTTLCGRHTTGTLTQSSLSLP